MNREKLINYYETQKWIDDEIELYEEQRQKAEGIKAVVIDGMPKAHNKPNYAIENLIDKYNEILQHLYDLQEEQNKIVFYLEKMNNATYRRILFLKYIRGYSLEEVAVKIKKDYKYTCNLHGYALNEFDNLENVNLREK